MSLFPCTSCQERATEKYANVTMAYRNAAYERLAWRHRMCAACWASTVQPVLLAVRSDPYNCPMCHTDPGEDLDPTYFTAYVPGYGKLQIEAATDGPCAAELRLHFQDGATKLADRQAASVGQDPGPQTDPATSVWQALGIEPRD